MWWIYFHKGAEAGSEIDFEDPSESGRLARLAYTYLHMPIVAGIIVAAVADELVLKHPDGHSDLKTVLSAIGGPLLFLVGTILFKHAIRGFLQLSHGVGIIALGVARLVRGRPVAAVAVDPHHRDHDRGRGVGIDFATIEAGGIKRSRRCARANAGNPLFLIDDVLEYEVRQADHERPKPGVFLKQATQVVAVRVAVPAVVVIAAR